MQAIKRGALQLGTELTECQCARVQSPFRCDVQPPDQGRSEDAHGLEAVGQGLSHACSDRVYVNARIGEDTDDKICCGGGGLLAHVADFLGHADENAVVGDAC